jgi:hypothetical protein
VKTQIFKIKKSGKIMTSLILLFISVLFYSQENSLQLKSTSAGIGYFLMKTNFHNSSREKGGLAFQLNLLAAKNNNIFKISYILGNDLAIYGSSDFKVNEFNLMYGRESKVKNWLSLQGFAGIGYIHLIDKTEYNIGTSTENGIFKNETYNKVAFPLSLNINFLPDNRIGFGISTNYNINSSANNFSQQIYLTYNFKN